MIWDTVTGCQTDPAIVLGVPATIPATASSGCSCPTRRRTPSAPTWPRRRHVLLCRGFGANTTVAGRSPCAAIVWLESTKTEGQPEVLRAGCGADAVRNRCTRRLRCASRDRAGGSSPRLRVAPPDLSPRYVVTMLRLHVHELTAFVGRVFLALTADDPRRQDCQRCLEDLGEGVVPSQT
jgi:hypothetical protein